MPEYDALGREVGEDTLAGLRGEDGGETKAPPPAARPVEPAGGGVRPQPARPPSRPTSPGRRRGGIGFGRIVPLILVAGIAVALISSATHTVSSVSHVIKGIHIPDFKVPANLKTPVPGPDPTGLTGHSMLRPANLRHALTQLRDGPGTRLRFLRVAPERVDAQLTAGGGRLELLQVTPNSRAATKVSVSGGGFPTSNTIPLRAVDPAAPARLVHAAARRAHVPVSRVQYAVLLSLAGDQRWSVFVGSSQWLGDAHGHLQQRVG